LGELPPLVGGEGDWERRPSCEYSLVGRSCIAPGGWSTTERESRRKRIVGSARGLEKFLRRWRRAR
jgi:hypothetical protein